MEFISRYVSPIGEILLSADEVGLTGLWFKGQKYFALYLDKEYKEDETQIIKKAKTWLDIYFAGQNPNFQLPIHFKGTEFQKQVGNILYTIPYGQTVTYKEIANKVAKQNSIKIMSAQAVGGAVSHNPISIIVPCHRVMGSNGNLTGYAGGLKKKIALLELEKII